MGPILGCMRSRVMDLGLPRNRCTSKRGPCDNKDGSSLRSILGFPYLWKLPQVDPEPKNSDYNGNGGYIGVLFSSY